MIKIRNKRNVSLNFKLLKVADLKRDNSAIDLQQKIAEHARNAPLYIIGKQEFAAKQIKSGHVTDETQIPESDIREYTFEKYGVITDKAGYKEFTDMFKAAVDENRTSGTFSFIRHLKDQGLEKYQAHIVDRVTRSLIKNAKGQKEKDAAMAYSSALDLMSVTGVSGLTPHLASGLSAAVDTLNSKIKSPVTFNVKLMDLREADPAVFSDGSKLIASSLTPDELSGYRTLLFLGAKAQVDRDAQGLKLTKEEYLKKLAKEYKIREAETTDSLFLTPKFGYLYKINNRLGIGNSSFSIRGVYMTAPDSVENVNGFFDSINNADNFKNNKNMFAKEQREIIDTLGTGITELNLRDVGGKIRISIRTLDEDKATVTTDLKDSSGDIIEIDPYKISRYGASAFFPKQEPRKHKSLDEVEFGILQDKGVASPSDDPRLRKRRKKKKPAEAPEEIKRKNRDSIFEDVNEGDIKLQEDEIETAFKSASADASDDAEPKGKRNTPFGVRG